MRTPRGREATPKAYDIWEKPGRKVDHFVFSFLLKWKVILILKFLPIVNTMMRDRAGGIGFKIFQAAQ
jgi:hypothetical protein